VASSSSPPTGADSDVMRFRPAPVVACLLLGLMAFLAGGAAWRESATFDEVAHIGAGVSYVEKLDLRFNEEHPPLAKVIAAIPLVLVGTRVDYGHVSWTYSTKFLPHAFLGQWVFGEWLLTRWNAPHRVLAWARLPMLLFTLGLGWAVFVYARTLGGDWGGLLSLAAYVSTPTFLAFGPLVHTDIAVTLFCLVALWQLAELWREPSRPAAVRFALALAGALLSKFSAGLLFFAMGGLAVSLRLWPLHGLPQEKTELRAWRRRRWSWAQKSTALAAIVVYAFYFLFSLHQSTDALSLVGHSSKWVPLRRLLMPPWLYLRGLVLFLATSSRATFLFGQRYPHGVWFFYPVLLALKSPLGFVGLVALLLVLALWLKLRRGQVQVIPPKEGWRWRAIWVACVVFAAACMLSQMSISIRHFSVPIVLLIVMLAPLPRLIRSLGRQSRAGARVAGALTVLLAASSLLSVARAFPYYFPYFNALSRSHPAYWWAADSNVDWNQALPEARDFASRHGLATLNVDSYALSDPADFVPQAHFWKCQQPAPEDANQWVVVSSNMILDQFDCSWLMQYPHEMLGGGSMWAVHLPPAIPAAGSPGGPPPANQRRHFLGLPQDVRLADIQLVQHPELFPHACDEAEAQIKKALGM